MNNEHTHTHTLDATVAEGEAEEERNSRLNERWKKTYERALRSINMQTKPKVHMHPYTDILINWAIYLFYLHTLTHSLKNAYINTQLYLNRFWN